MKVSNLEELKERLYQWCDEMMEENCREFGGYAITYLAFQALLDGDDLFTAITKFVKFDADEELCGDEALEARFLKTMEERCREDG